MNYTNFHLSQNINVFSSHLKIGKALWRLLVSGLRDRRSMATKGRHGERCEWGQSAPWRRGTDTHTHERTATDWAHSCPQTQSEWVPWAVPVPPSWYCYTKYRHWRKRLMDLWDLLIRIFGNFLWIYNYFKMNILKKLLIRRLYKPSGWLNLTSWPLLDDSGIYMNSL